MLCLHLPRSIPLVVTFDFDILLQDMEELQAEPEPQPAQQRRPKRRPLIVSDDNTQLYAYMLLAGAGGCCNSFLQPSLIVYLRLSLCFFSFKLTLSCASISLPLALRHILSFWISIAFCSSTLTDGYCVSLIWPFLFLYNLFCLTSVNGLLFHICSLLHSAI